jgi:dUTP pyrophosphatase
MSKGPPDGDTSGELAAPLAVNISRVDRSLPLPRYATAGSVGFDLVCRVETIIGPGEIGLVPGNVIVHTPPGYMLLVVPRSSTPRRLGLVSPHGAGIIDQDYCGPDDEILIQLLNIRTEPVTVPRGERIAQGVFVRVAIAEWREVEPLDRPSRGGFGST